jgi:hypothetical protein
MAAVRSLAAAVVLTAAAVGVGIALHGGGGGGGEGPREPSASAAAGTPLSAYDTSTVAVDRSAFCSGLQPADVTAALGGEPESSSSYGNGQRGQLTRTVEDVAHEYSCTWVGPDGATARGWVFAPPVTPGEARALAKAAAREPGCDALPGAPDFGSPTAAIACTGAGDQRVSFRGLFGDAWLACSVSAPRTAGLTQDALVDRAGRWCVSVARAASRQAD